MQSPIPVLALYNTKIRLKETFGGIGYTMQEFNHLVDEYNIKADSAQSSLKQALASIARGFAPSESEIERVKGSLNDLRESYCSICDYVHKAIPELDVADDASIAEYENAMEREIAQKARRKLDAAKAKLERFASIKAKIETYAHDLKPYQDEALAKLELLSNEEALPVEESAEQEAHTLFLAAFDSDDLTEGTGASLIEQVSSRFSFRIAYGLMQRAYYEGPDGDGDFSHETIMGAKPPKEVGANNPEEGLQPTADDSQERIEEADPGSFTEEDVPRMVSTRSSLKDSRPNASKFKELMGKPNTFREAVYAILPLMTQYSAMTKEQILTCLSLKGYMFDNESIAGGLNWLEQKKLLAAYSVDDDQVYCLTGYAHGCLAKETVSNDDNWLAPIQFGKKIIAKPQMSYSTLAECVSLNYQLLSLAEWLKNTCEGFAGREGFGITDQGPFVVIPIGPSDDVEFGLGENAQSTNRIVYADSESSLSPPVKQGFSGLTLGFTNDCLYLYQDGEWVEYELFDSAQGNEGQQDQSAGATDISDKANEGPNNVGEELSSDNRLEPDSGQNEVASSEVFGNLLDMGFHESQQPAGEESEGHTPKEIQGDLTTESKVVGEITGSAKDVAQKLLDSDVSVDELGEFEGLIAELVSENVAVATETVAENSVAQALMLAKTLAMQTDSYALLHKRMIYAFDSSLTQHQYEGIELYNAFGCEDEQVALSNSPILQLASIIRAMFSPAVENDPTLQMYAQELFDNYDTCFVGLEGLKALYYLLLKLTNVSPAGFSRRVLRHFAKENDIEEQIRELRASAQRLQQTKNIKVAEMRAIAPMIANCFGANSDIGLCMSIIAGDRREDYEVVMDAYSVFCINENPKNGIDTERKKSFIDDSWKQAVESIRRGNSHFELQYRQRRKVDDALNERIDLMAAWLELVEPQSEAITALADLRVQILKEIEVALANVANWGNAFDRAVVEKLLSDLKRRLSDGSGSDGWEFADYMHSDAFAIDGDSGRPILDPLFVEQEGFEPWRRALLHIASPVVEFDDVLRRIASTDCDSYCDNIGQAVAICRYQKQRGANRDEILYLKDKERAHKLGKSRHIEFKGRLELAFAYGRIQEKDKERLSEAAEAAFAFFSSCTDYGCFVSFLGVLDTQIASITSSLKSNLLAQLEVQKSIGQGEQLLEKAEAELSDERLNLALAEEYLNRHVVGSYEVTSIIEDSRSNELAAFLDGPFDRIYSLCNRHRDGRLIDFAWGHVESRLKKKGLGAQYQRQSQAFIKNMPERPDETVATTSRIAGLLRGLGFQHVIRCDRVDNAMSGTTMAYFKADIRQTEKSRTEFSHPISIMGTKLESPLDVICLFGRKEANDIVDKVCNLELGGTAIVFLNGSLSSPGRRKLADAFHRNKRGMNSFLLIDWPLLLYLAEFPQNERLPIMLSCTLPYTSSHQPFVEKGQVSDEMFIGRKRELNRIMDPQGPSLVYGGRQLGKTALLKRANSQSFEPDKGRYSVFISAMTCKNESDLASAIAEELEISGLAIGPVDSVKALCAELRVMYNRKKWKRLYLFVDEIDDVLKEFSTLTPAYAPIIELHDLARKTNSNFKFVFAGLHNVCRAAKDPNSVFGQLGEPLCIRPLSTADAYELLAKPLRYMGFAVNTDDLMHILVNTNFYPGIVHSVGYALVENLSTRYRDFYNQDDNPPYGLTDKQLSGVLSGADLNAKIASRILLTLRADPTMAYLMLARCIAYLYHESPENNGEGYSVDEIKEYANLLGIECLSTRSKSEYLLLLDELVDMGILVKPSSESYRLRQHRFLDVIGPTVERIEVDIANDQEEAND